MRRKVKDIIKHILIATRELFVTKLAEYDILHKMKEGKDGENDTETEDINSANGSGMEAYFS